MAEAQRVLVTGAGGPSGRAAVQALRERGLFVLAADMLAVDHAANSFSLLPPALDTRFTPRLLDLLREERIDWLFPTVQEELVQVAELAPRLRDGGVAVYISAPGAVRICHDKWETARNLLAQGIAVPRSAAGAAGEPAVTALGYPAVSRPRVGRGGRGVTVHDAPGIAPAAGELVWQEFMPGTEYDVLLLRHPVAPHEFLVLHVFEKTLLRDGRVGNALEIRTVGAADVVELAKQAARALDLRGPADMDIRRGADGAPRLLEINARIGAHSLRAPELFDALVRLFQEGCRG